jgi:hypothetical protein
MFCARIAWQNIKPLDVTLRTLPVTLTGPIMSSGISMPLRLQSDEEASLDSQQEGPRSLELMRSSFWHKAAKKKQGFKFKLRV